MKRYLLFLLSILAAFASCAPFLDANHGGATYNFVNTTWEGTYYPKDYFIADNVYDENNSLTSNSTCKSLTIQTTEVKFSKIQNGEGTLSVKRTTSFAPDFPEIFGPAIIKDGKVLKSVTPTSPSVDFFGEILLFANDSIAEEDKLNRYPNWAGKVIEEYTEYFNYYVSKNNHQYDYMLVPTGYTRVSYDYTIEKKNLSATCYEASLSDNPTTSFDEYKMTPLLFNAQSFTPVAQGGSYTYTISKGDKGDYLTIDFAGGVLTKKKGGK